MRTLLTFAISILRSALALFRSREEQVIVELALRQQLAVYAQNHQRPRLSPLDRTFWVVLSRFWPRWKNHLVVVRPETVVRWHRNGFRRYWRSISAPGPGRPPISKEVQELIVRMATENALASPEDSGRADRSSESGSASRRSRGTSPRSKPDPTSSSAG